MTYTYDENDHLVSKTDPKGRVTRYTYEEGGALATRHALNGITMPGDVSQVIHYDALGRLSGIENALGRTTVAYHEGDVISVDAEGHRSILSYNHLGLLCRATDGEGGVNSCIMTLACNARRCARATAVRCNSPMTHKARSTR